MQADILDGVLGPQLILRLRQEHEREGDLIHYHVDVFLNHATRHLKLDSYLHALQRHAQRFSAHELLTLGQNDVQVALNREKQLKRWSRRKKEALINSDSNLLTLYSKRKSRQERIRKQNKKSKK